MTEAYPFGLPVADLDACVARSLDDLATLGSTRILLTGGTGFLGSWLVATLVRARALGKLDGELVVVSRDPARSGLEPRDGLCLWPADVVGLERDPHLGTFDLVIHAAASSSATYGVADGHPRAMAHTVVHGTESVLALAERANARLVLLSSGAIYGRQHAPVPEDAPGAPDPLEPAGAYGHAKRLAENLCASAAADGVLQAVIARLFAFIGPRIPLDAHYAAGNFLLAAHEGRDLLVTGDGRPLRSYLYCGDLCSYLLALAARGESGRAYNIGGPGALSIRELAETVAAHARTAVRVVVARQPSEGPAPCYVPEVTRVREELGLFPATSLDDAIDKTLSWMEARR